jgi:phosphatidylserine/phosphatidylglycerophosphate/cardiolipin synthase-like enzyme
MFRNLMVGLLLVLNTFASDFVDKPLLMDTFTYRGYYEKHVAQKLHKMDYGYHDCAVNIKMDKDEVYGAALDMMESAKKQIMFNMYLFGGQIGEDVLAVLERKRSEGVEVFLLLSKVKQSFETAEEKQKQIFEELYESEQKGEHVEKPPYMQKMSKAIHMGFPVINAETKFIDAFAPVRIDHNKLLVVDGVKAMLGGMNFATTVAKNRDSMVEVAGPYVNELQKMFVNNMICGYAKDEITQGLMTFDHDKSVEEMNKMLEKGWTKTQARITMTSPYIRNTRSELIKLFDNAKDEIFIVQLLFNDTELLQALARAAKRGVKIRMLLDPAAHLYYRDWHGGPNNKAVGLFQRIKKAHPELDIDVRHYKCGPGQELHVKLCIIDDEVTGLGSTNFTSGAFQSNYEMFTLFKSKEFAAKYKKIWMNDFENQSLIPPHVGLKRTLISIFSDFIF